MRNRPFFMAALLFLGAELLATDYLTHGVDPGRTGWLKDERVFTLENVKASGSCGK